MLLSLPHWQCPASVAQRLLNTHYRCTEKMVNPECLWHTVVYISQFHTVER